MAEVGKPVTRHDTERRLVRFTVRVVRLARKLNETAEGRIIAKQVLRSASSIGANHREAGRASSRRQFISMLEIAQREAAETAYWLEVIAEASLVTAAALQPLRDEAEELLAILTSSIRTVKQNPPP